MSDQCASVVEFFESVLQYSATKRAELDAIEADARNRIHLAKMASQLKAAEPLIVNDSIMRLDEILKTRTDNNPLSCENAAAAGNLFHMLQPRIDAALTLPRKPEEVTPAQPTIMTKNEIISSVAAGGVLGVGTFIMTLGMTSSVVVAGVAATAVGAFFVAGTPIACAIIRGPIDKK